MALFNRNKGGLPYEIVREGEETILKINCENLTTVPSIEDNPSLMAFTIDRLIENRATTKIVFIQKRDYEYDYAQTRLLMEIAVIYNKLVKQKDVFSYEAIRVKTPPRYVDRIYNQIHHLIFDVLKRDPLTCFVELRRLLRHERILLETESGDSVKAHKLYVKLLTYLLEELDKTRLITIAKPFLAGLKPFDRSVYSKIFSPTIKPDFMFTKLMATYPKNST
ncbi:MAG TPA: hypothetical protein ENL16_02555, partial [Candidatus Woesearchaeota archaeon]|nr:hypothetical protein [Candidatus Woesearchaeota archaeon]